MVSGRRIFGRAQVADTRTAAKDAVVAAQPRGLTTVAELLRAAAWDRLTDTERAVLLAPYQRLTLPALGDASAANERTEAQIQDWVAGLVASRLQPEVAWVIRMWLEDTSPDAHLFIGGHDGLGATSLVASLARQMLAGHPPTPDYSYVPHPTTLDRSALLALPPGTGAAFSRALAPALGKVCEGWKPANSDEDKEDEHAAGDERESALRDLVARVLASVEEVAPESGRAYLARLRTTLEALVGTGKAPLFCEMDVSIGHVRINSDEITDAGAVAANASGEAVSSAPVVVTRLAQSDLGNALLRANGGVLVLAADDLVEGDKPTAAWLLLASVLRTRALKLQPGLPPVPIAVRVAMVGPYDPYQTLYFASADFAGLFRYEVSCNAVADWTRESEAVYAALAAGVARRHSLPQPEPSAVARLVEEAARRIGGNRNRSLLTTDLLALRDLCLEAGCVAAARAAVATTGADVETAVQRRLAQQGANARRVREFILDGYEIVPTAGEEVGQVNGLTVLSSGSIEETTGAPVRISATVSPGRQERLVDIEREARVADASHIQGALTMTGYLARRYGLQRPVSLLARIRFEQGHDRVRGDSASAAELFALLSALSQVPIRCSLAVTGAVGQYGEIQPIGGVNHKIEGFWEICRARRAKGEQPVGAYGVLIPAANVADLMLRREVAEAIAGEGWFHVWPISTVDEGLPLLTALPAEEIHARVDRQLQRFYELAAQSRASR